MKYMYCGYEPNGRITVIVHGTINSVKDMIGKNVMMSLISGAPLPLLAAQVLNKDAVSGLSDREIKDDFIAVKRQEGVMLVRKDDNNG